MHHICELLTCYISLRCLDLTERTKFLIACLFIAHFSVFEGIAEFAMTINNVVIKRVWNQGHRKPLRRLFRDSSSVRVRHSIVLVYMHFKQNAEIFVSKTYSAMEQRKALVGSIRSHNTIAWKPRAS